MAKKGKNEVLIKNYSEDESMQMFSERQKIFDYTVHLTAISFSI